MAKEVVMLGLEDGFLRGVRLEGDAAAWTRRLEDAWPLTVPEEEKAPEAADEAVEATEEVVAEDRPLARAFKAAAARFGRREFALSLPLSCLLVRVVRLPIEARDDLLAAALTALETISPFPDEILTPAAEVLAETDRELVVLVAALPAEACADVTEALTVAKVRITRTDISMLGWLRGLWAEVCARAEARRRVVLMHLGATWDLAVLDEGAPVYLRGIGAVDSAAALGREVTLSLLQIEGDTPEGPVDVVVCAPEMPPEDVRARLAAFGEVRFVRVEDVALGVEGAAYRAVEGATLDVTPADWREQLVEARFRRKLYAALGVAVGLWVALMGVFYGVDATYDFLADQQKDLCLEPRHKRAYQQMTDMTNSVVLIERYADHARGALEILLQVTKCLPDVGDEMTLRSLKYERDGSVRLQGTARERDDVYKFIDNLGAAVYEAPADAEEDAEREPEKIFGDVRQTGTTKVNNKGTIPFNIDAFFPQALEDSNGDR